METTIFISDWGDIEPFYAGTGSKLVRVTLVQNGWLCTYDRAGANGEILISATPSSAGAELKLKNCLEDNADLRQRLDELEAENEKLRREAQFNDARLRAEIGDLVGQIEAYKRRLQDASS